MDYLLLKHLHQTAAALSLLGFLARGLGALAGAAWVRGRAAKSLPHVVDSLLLLSALAMLWVLGLNPLQLPWLTAKILALLAYIGLGVVALRPGLARGPRALALLAALAVFGYIVSVAISKRPAGWFSAWA